MRRISPSPTRWPPGAERRLVPAKSNLKPQTSCELALRAVGAAQGRPGGAPPARVWGVWGQALSHHRLPTLWAGCRGPLPTGCGCVGGAGLGTRHQPHSARSCVLWGRHEGARGGRLLPGCGASGVGRSPYPDCPPSWRAAGAHYPLAVDAGGCGRGDPSRTPQRALLRAGFAPCGGGMRMPGGGASCLGVGRPGSRALPPPTASSPGGLPGSTTQWPWLRGAAGVGTRHQPDSARSCELALRAVGAAQGRPGGAPLAWVWGVRGQALSLPRLPVFWAGCRGPLPTGCWCGGVRAWKPFTNPTASALACCGGGMRVPWGGRLLPGCGASGLRRSPNPNCPPSGRAAGAHYQLAVGAGGCGLGDPSPTPQRALLRATGAARGFPGGAPLAWVWGVRGRALSHPRLPALWAGCRGPLPTGCGCGGVRVWGPVTNPTARALASWLCALWGRHEGARRGRLLPVFGPSGVGRPPSPDCPPSGRAAGAHYQLAVGAGGCGLGDPSPTPQRALLRAVGAAREFPGGAPLAWVWGVRGRALSHPRLPALWAGCRGPLPTGCGCGGVRVWGPVTNPTARALASWLCALWGRHEGARGGRLLPGFGPSGVGRPASPDCPPSGWAAGAHHPLAVGARGCGPGDPSPTRQRALLRAVGAARGCPGGAPLAWLWGVRDRALSQPRLPALWAGCRGPLPTGCGCWGVRAWGPVTNPTARALASWLCALWGRHEGVREGRLLPGCRASAVRRSPTPDCPPSWWAARAHYPLAPGAGGAGVGTRQQPHSARSCELALRAVGAARGRPGGGAPCLGVGRPGSGALPPPTARPLGGLPGPTTHWLWVRGGASVGTRHQPRSARSCVLWGRHEGARGGCLLPGCGASGFGRSPTTDCPPSGRAAGAHYQLAVGAGGCARVDPSPTPQRALLPAVGAA